VALAIINAQVGELPNVPKVDGEGVLATNMDACFGVPTTPALRVFARILLLAANATTCVRVQGRRNVPVVGFVLVRRTRMAACPGENTPTAQRVFVPMGFPVETAITCVHHRARPNALQVR
jgi:hypothetical protein